MRQGEFSMVNAEIIAIGSELLLGQIVDTNSAWIAQQLTGLGVNLYYKTIVGDNPSRMREVINRALDRSDVVITGGGLGPTQDDLTREVIAQVTGRKLIRDRDLLQDLQERFRSRGFIMTANNERQADIPQGATTVHNPNGTAPSFLVEDPRGVIFALPGVPHELKWLFDHEVIPYLRRCFQLDQIIFSRILKVSSLGESNVDHRIGHLIAKSINPTVGVLAHPGQVDVRITAKAANREAASGLIGPMEEKIRKLLGQHVFAADQESMEDSVGKLLKQKNLSIAVYEDITGGLVAQRLQKANTMHFVEGTIANNPASIQRILLTSGSDFSTSEPEALTQKLAQTVRSLCNVELGLAVHGIPDPNDRSHNLSRGQTYLCVTDGMKVKTCKYQMAGRGHPDQIRMSLNALDLLRLALLGGMGTAHKHPRSRA